MEKVSGRGAWSNAKQPADRDQHAKDFPCDQCKESDLVIPAAGFCESCTDYLCSSCLNLHKNLRALRDHIVLYGDDMPSHRPTFVNEETCSKHPGRKVEMFCCDDETLGCALCFVEGHSRCLNKSLISTLSENMESSDEMSKIQTASQKHKELTAQLMQLIQNCRLTNEHCHAKCLKNFQNFRVEIEALLDKLEDEVTNDAERVKRDNNEKLDRLTDMILSYKQQVDTCMENIDSCSALKLKPNDQLFIAVKKNKGQILDSVQKLENLSKEIQIREFGFLPSVKHILEKCSKIFLKEVSSTTSADQSKMTESHVPVEMEGPPSTVCTAMTKIPIKSPDDKSDCIVCGIVAISDTQQIVTDYTNNCLKFVDTTNNQIIKRRFHTSSPADVTSLPRGRVAVTFPQIKQIQIYYADINMNLCTCIDVDGQCWGIRCTGETLVLTVDNPAKVEILDLNGKVLHSIQHDRSGCDLFQNPRYLTLSRDNKFIYVTDDGNNTLTCLDMTGVHMWVYRDNQLTSPEGVTTGDGGCIYVCSWRNHTIHVVSREGAKLGVISLGEKGLLNPKAVLYSRQNRTLYVSSEKSEQSNCISRLSMQYDQHVHMGLLRSLIQAAQIKCTFL